MVKKVKLKRKRYDFLDMIRGIIILLMVMDHFFYDFGYLITLISNYSNSVTTSLTPFVEFSRFYWNNDVRIFIRYIVLFLFFFISGISCSFSRSNIKRGLRFLLFAVIETGISLFALLFKEEVIISGIFWVYGISILLGTLIYKLFKKVFKKDLYPSLILIVLGASLLIIYMTVLSPIFEKPIWKIESFLDVIEVLIGKKQYGLDWMSLLPHMACLFLGIGAGKLIFKERKVNVYKAKDYSYIKRTSVKDNKNILFKIKNIFKKIELGLAFVGRKTAYIYILHQIPIVLILGICILANGYQLTIF